MVTLRRVVHCRSRYRRTCHCHGTKGVVSAPPPPKVIAKSRFSVGFLARLVVVQARRRTALPAPHLFALP